VPDAGFRLSDIPTKRLIGVDPKQPDPFFQVDPWEPSEWFAKLESFFVHNHHPEWRYFSVSYGDKLVHAIAFETSSGRHEIAAVRLSKYIAKNHLDPAL
jgi:hypothetical protein